MLSQRRDSSIQNPTDTPTPSTSTSRGQQEYPNQNQSYLDDSIELTYAEILSAGDDWLDPYSSDTDETSFAMQRKRSTTYEIKDNSSSNAYSTQLRPRAKSLRDTTTHLKTHYNEETNENQLPQYADKRSIDKPTTKYSHPPRARSRVLKSPPPPVAVDMDKQPPSLPNVDFQQIKEELLAHQTLPVNRTKPHHQRQKSLQHTNNINKETASVINNVKRKLSLRDKTNRDTMDHTLISNHGTASTTSNAINTATTATNNNDNSNRKSRNSSHNYGIPSDYQGNRSSRHRPIYSPPPRSSSHSRHSHRDNDNNSRNTNNSRNNNTREEDWTTSDDDGTYSVSSFPSQYEFEIIPPVPPVPKHHSIKFSNNINNNNSDNSDSNNSNSNPILPCDYNLTTKTKIEHNNSNNNISSRGTFGSLEEIIQKSLKTELDQKIITVDEYNQLLDNQQHLQQHQQILAETTQKQIDDSLNQYNAFLDNLNARPHSKTSSRLSSSNISSTTLLPRTSSKKISQHSPKLSGLKSEETTRKTTNRKRGKTLPGSLATPPPIPSLPLPPMKLEPISLMIPTTTSNNNSNNNLVRKLSKSPSRRSTTTTPTRIPIPKPPSALSTGSRSSTTNEENTLSTPHLMSYTSSEDEGLLSSKTITKNYNNNKSKSVSLHINSNNNNLSLTPPIPDRKKSLRSSELSSSPSIKPSPKSSPKSSPKMKLTRSTSTSSGLNNNVNNNNHNNPASLGGDVLQRKPSSSRRNKTPTNYVPKLAAHDYTDSSLILPSKTKHMDNQHHHYQQYNENNTNSSIYTDNGSLVRTTSLHSTRKKTVTGPSDTIQAKERPRTVSLHEKSQPYVAQQQTMNITHKMPQPVTSKSTSYSKEPSNAITSTSTNHQHHHRHQRTQSNNDIRPADPPVRTAKSPQTSLKYYSQYLTHYERMEILEYPNIYFIGPHAKKYPAFQEQPMNNYGYDDENGDYKIIRQDHLIYRYEILDVLGQGSFGQVVKCFDHKTGLTMAIKLIRNKKRFHAQALTEIKILKNLIEWDPEDKYHNIRMLDYFYFRHHLCVAFECMSMNLYEFIKKNNFQGFSISLIRKFTKQILYSLCLLYKHRVIHCDLKPENILLKHPGKSTIKVIDFGSSCLETERVYTYIQSRFYRAPEVILSIPYNTSIDMWSLGCIIAELYTGIPIFPGENENEQLACMMEVLGLPDRHLIEESSRRKLFFDSQGNARVVVNSKGKRRSPGTKNLAQVLRCNDPLFLDFIQRCLCWDPRYRMTAIEAMDHEWIQQRTATTSSSNATQVQTQQHQYQHQQQHQNHHQTQPHNLNQRQDKLKMYQQQQPITPKLTATSYQLYRKMSIG